MRIERVSLRTFQYSLCQLRYHLTSSAVPEYTRDTVLLFYVWYIPTFWQRVNGKWKLLNKVML